MIWKALGAKNFKPVPKRLNHVTHLLSRYTTDSSSNIKTGKIFLSGLAPHYLGRFDPRIYLPTIYKDGITDIKEKYLPETLPFQAKLKQVEYRSKEGGAILEFEYLVDHHHGQDGQVGETTETMNKISNTISEYIATNRKRGFLNLYRLFASPIKGEPFLEDLAFSLPTRVLKVEFIGPSICEEDLFREFRPFGRISKITIHNPESSGFPKYALVHFFNVAAATSARICLNGQKDCPTRFSISYKKRDANFWNWFSSHPRIMIPLIIGSILGFLYTVFDPVRVFSISSHISGRFDLAELAFLKEMKFFALRLLQKREQSDSLVKLGYLSGVEQEDKIHELRQLLVGLPESFVFLLGPNGSGREVALVKSLEGRKNVLHISCDKISHNHEDIDFSSLAKEVGYFPVFDLVNKGAQLADKFLVSVTGKPSDLSPSSQNQFQNLLDCTQLALTDFSTGNSDEPLPVIVFHNFMLKDSPDSQWNKVTQWAAEIVERKLAHVVFSSESAVTARILDKSLPYRPLTIMEFEDIELGEAINYVQARINQYLPMDIRHSIQHFGGRISDLNLFSLKVIKGEKLEESFDEIVASAESEIRKKLFGEPWHKNSPLITLSWLLVEALSTKKEVGYDEIRYSPAYIGTDKELSDLETAGVISIELGQNKQRIIKPGRPIFCKAFQNMANDTHLAAAVSRFRFEHQLKDRQQKVLSVQEELAKLATVRVDIPFPWYRFALVSYWLSSSSSYLGAPAPVKSRIKYLLSKLKKLQSELQQAEDKVKEANSILQRPYYGLS